MKRYLSFLSVALLCLSLASETSVASSKTEEAMAVIKNAERVRQIRVPMRDGISLNVDLLFPDKAKKNLPTVLIRTPYSFELELNEKRAIMLADFLKRGYVLAMNHERGRYFSEGEFTFLAGAKNDGYDVVDWLVKQSWSNGKVGTIGCSSAAENQLALSVANHPGHVAMVAAAPAAGIGKIGPFQEQGLFYRGGAWMPVALPWFHAYGSQYKPELPKNLTQEQRAALSQVYTLEPQLEKVDYSKVLWHLPVSELPEKIGTLPSVIHENVKRTPNDPDWAKTDFINDGDRMGTPALWIFSWYDMAAAPNIELFNNQRKNAVTQQDRDNQFMVVGPMGHCVYGTETENTVVGERSLGDARFDYHNLIMNWFDYWLKGIKNGVTERPKIELYTMGENKWKQHNVWPPAGTKFVSYYLSSEGRANSRFGDGVLSLNKPEKETFDQFTYDPKTPVPTLGGAVCCMGPEFKPGAYDQSSIEMRNDVLVYTSEPLEQGIEVTGPVDVVLYISSDARDTDFTVKLIDVDTEGRAYNLDDTIQRVRYREGYDKAVFMEKGQVYEVKLGPLATSNYFKPGHRIRIEVSSSNFPLFDRNLNTGGNNFDEKDPVVARNSVHHAPAYLSRITLPVR